MGKDDQALVKKIQHLQNMLGEINKYLQGSSSKPPAMISRLLDEKTRITAQLRELNNIYSCRAEEPVQSGRSLSSIYSVAGGDKAKEAQLLDGGEKNLIDKRVELEEILREMEITTEVDQEIKKIILGGADIFIDNVIATACTIARNRDAKELEKKDILLSMKMERGLQMKNVFIYNRSREPDKEHIKRIQMIKKDQKKVTNK